jgi:hypothetical protein
MRTLNWLLVAGILILHYGHWGNAAIPPFLQRWQDSPKAASLETPEKKGSWLPLKFSDQEILEGEFIASKNAARLAFCRQNGHEDCNENFGTLGLVTDAYSLFRFIGEKPESNILELARFANGTVTVTPWSGSYWPQYKGGIGIRYGDPNFPHSKVFVDNFKFYQKQYHKSPRTISNFNILSPAEKYDLLTEDKDWSMTYYSWAVPRRSYQMSGRVETWTGICHGWAAAAMEVAEPRQSFSMNLPGLDRTMTVYPDDVKALTSQLWASARLNAFFIGGRCDVKSPEADANGRLTDPNCFDVNPATWHLALLNRVGKQGKSFVFDATYDFEVWNQPIASYDLQYFNPRTKHTTSSLKEAMVPYATISNDPYAQYRSPKTKFLVGIELELSYVVENLPRQITGVSNASPNIFGVQYYYDLEIDENNQVIGGEWYQAAHPDMFWRSGLARPLANGELETSYWDGVKPINSELKTLAKSATKLNQPLRAIVEPLILKSKRD